MWAFSKLETFFKWGTLADWTLFFHLTTYLPCLMLRSSLNCLLTCLFSLEMVFLLASPLSFFDIFVQIENNTFESLLWHLKKMPLAAQNGPYMASIVYKLFPQNEVEFLFMMLLFSSSLTILSHFFTLLPNLHNHMHPQIAQGNSRSGMHGSLCQQRNTFCSLSITAHLAGCLFIHSAYSAKARSLERFQLWDSRKWL